MNTHTNTADIAAARAILSARTVDYPAPWACRAVVTERAALEHMRDMRTGHLSDPAIVARFDAASTSLTLAEAAHIASTGCTDRH